MWFELKENEGVRKKEREKTGRNNYKNMNKYSQLQGKYKIKQYINDMSWEVDQETLENTNVSRYFKIKKEELTRIILNVDIYKEFNIQGIIDQRG